MWQYWVIFFIGLWVIIAPYLGFTYAGLASAMVITGIIVAILAIWGVIAYPKIGPNKSGGWPPPEDTDKKE
ncbi:MAG: SPW repeat protein [Patescibacteria group bacterium]|nr:SPW repeat protein [Patescibacteria group bacterium]